MKISVYNNFPNCAKAIREAVFINEQEFQQEFDEIDNTATHFVLFDDKIPIATCRVFILEYSNNYNLQLYEKNTSNFLWSINI